MTPSHFDSLRANRLEWLPELALGFLDQEAPGLYDDAYFAHYAALAETPMGRQINAARCSLVRRHWPGPVVDVGIGSGSFIQAMPPGSAAGWDVNPHALRWLAERDLLHDPRHVPVQAATFWDSLEHMREPGEILRNVMRFAFVSLPIFADCAHVTRSKHYKPGEHLWYFTAPGLLRFMAGLGFELREQNAEETALGREDVQSFAFERFAP